MIRAEFEPTTWQAFWIATVEGRTAAEIAASLGITKHAVHQAKYRVLRRLREEMADLE
jgi:RNA polymerase sigma-70 factor (ECF subfamily)